MLHEMIPIVAMMLVFGIPLSGIWTHHRRKVLEMQLQLRNQGDNTLRAELETLRQEVRTLRDTTMQYDLSFDTALQRMESRVESLERQSNTAQGNDVARLNVGR